MNEKLSESFNLLDVISTPENLELKKRLKKRLNEDKTICFNDYYHNFGKKMFESESYSILLNNLDIITKELFEHTVFSYFKNKEDELMSFISIFIEKFEKFCFYKKFFKTILSILNKVLKYDYFSSNYETIEIINKLYYFQKEKEGKIGDSFLVFYKENLRILEHTKNNSFNLVSQKKLEAEDPVFLFESVYSNVNYGYQDSLTLKGFNTCGFDTDFIETKSCYSSFQVHNSAQVKRMYFFAIGKELVDRIRLSISENDPNTRFDKIMGNISKNNIENFYLNFLKKSKIYNFNKKEKELISDDFASLLNNYLIQANYSFFKLKQPTLSVLYIYLFLHSLNIYITGEQNNDINKGLDFLLGLDKQNDSNRDVFLSFLTKEKLGFDLRTAILHSTGYDQPSVEIFCFYFFSFINEVSTAQHKQNDIESKSNLLNEVCIDNCIENGEGNNEDFLISSKNDLSLFIINFVILESILYKNCKNPFLCNQKNDFLIMFSGFNALRNKFTQTELYKDNENDFKELFNLLYFVRNGKKVSLRNYIFHESSSNDIFSEDIAEYLRGFNEKCKKMRNLINKEVKND